MRVVIIDNDLSTLEALSFNLLKRGHMVCTSRDGRDGLDLALKTARDIVLLDLALPEVPGVEVCRRVREHSVVPVVFLSARAEDADRAAGLAAGADSYIAKPFGMLALMELLESLACR